MRTTATEIRLRLENATTEIRAAYAAMDRIHEEMIGRILHQLMLALWWRAQFTPCYPLLTYQKD